jgi:hypothetical protein
MPAKQLNGPKVVGLMVFLVLFSIVYYKYFLNVESSTNKKVEMLKRSFAFMIIIGLLNSLTITDDINYKALTLIIVVCFINIYNIRHVFKHCPSISPQYKVTLYIRTCIIIIITGLVLKYTNEKGLLGFLYTDDTDKTAKGTTSSTIGGDIKLLALPKMPDYCPDMDTDYEDDTTWTSLSPDDQLTCTNTYSEYTLRKDMSNDVYA